jgi:tRNA G46 methylase TrmB
LKTGGAVWVATDDSHYAGQIQKVFPEEKWSYKPGRSLYPTYFETKWKNLGRDIHYFCFGKSK